MAEPNAVEAEAREMGWVPLEEFRGGESKWVDAETFVERGKHVMPLLRSNNERLEARIQESKRETEALKRTLQETQESMKALREAQIEATQAAIAEERARLRAELKAARESGDVDQELEIQDKLSELKAAPKEAPKEPEPPAAPDPQANPEWTEWVAENSWFGKDTRKTARAMGFANLLRADSKYDNLQGKAFFNKVLEAMNEADRPAGKVDGGSGPARSGGKSGGYASLSAEAKAICDRQAARVVGENKAFKTIDEWRSHYAAMIRTEE